MKETEASGGEAKSLKTKGGNWSGRRDLNPGPPEPHSGTPIGLPSVVVRQVLVTQPFGALSPIPTFLNSRDYPPIPVGIAYNCVHAETSRRKPPNPESGGDDYA